MRADGLVSFPVPLAGLIANLPPQNVPPQGILDGLNVFVDNDGFLKPRAGYSPLGGLRSVISGSVSITGAATTAHAVLPIPYPNANYAVILGVAPQGAAADTSAVWYNRTTLGFDIEIGYAPGADTVIVYWFVPETADLQGVATFPAGVTTVNVLFSSPQLAANYGVTLGVGKGTGTPPLVAATSANPTEFGFDIIISGDPGGGNTVLVAWNANFPDAVVNTTHGTETFVGATVQQAITLASPQPDALYAIVLGAWDVGGGVDFSAVVDNVTNTGFDIRVSAAPGVDTFAVAWTVARLTIGNVGEPILGGIGFYDRTGTLQYVIGTQTRWWRFTATTWVDITDPLNPNNGSLDDQVRFVAFPYLGDIYVIGCNNTDPMRSWKPGDATYSTVTQAPICRDIEVIASRIMGVNTLEAGIRYSYRARWSNVNDFTTWQANSNQDLTDLAQPLVAVRRTGPSAAAIYGINGGPTIATGVPGTDATAFRFDEIVAPTAPGPCGPGALVSAVGLHFYHGLDGRIYQFDGNSIVPISGVVDAVLQPASALGFAGRFHAVYDKQLRKIWFFFVRAPDTEPHWAIPYNVDAQTFDVFQTFADFVTTSFSTVAQTSYTWLTWASATDTWLDLPYPSWAAIPNSTVPVMMLGTQDGETERFGFNSSDDGIAIPYSFVSSLQRLDPNQKQLPSVWDIFFRKQPVAESTTVTLATLAHPTATPRVVQDGTIVWNMKQDIPVNFFDAPNKPASGFAAKFGFYADVPPNEDVYLQMTIVGSTTRRLVHFGGSECFSWYERRA